LPRVPRTRPAKQISAQKRAIGNPTEVLYGHVDLIVVSSTDDEELTDEELDDLQRAAVRAFGDEAEIVAYAPALNPLPRRVSIPLAIGVGAAAAALAWWLTRPQPTKPNGLGQILCPVTAYDGSVLKKDYVVIELQAIDGTLAEPTWAVVERVQGDQILVKIVGEIADGSDPKPLRTDKHGYSVGDRVLIAKSCVYDRYRPGRSWQIVCGPALAPLGFGPIPSGQASALGDTDLALVVVKGAEGGPEAMWVEIGAVSSGQQVISGVVVADPQTTGHGLRRGDRLEFLRDCVVDAYFGGV